MKRILPYVFVSALAAGTMLLVNDAASAPPDAAPAFVLDAGSGSGSAAAATEPATSPAPAPLTEREQLDKVLHDFAAYRDEHDATARKLLLFGLIAAGAQLLMLLLKRATTFVPKYIPVVTLGLGAVVGLFSGLAMAQPLVYALLYGAAPPFAVFSHELMSLFKPKPKVPGSAEVAS